MSHGSHSPEWRRMLDEFASDVTPELLAVEGIHSVKSAFMEYTEPSIATRLKQFDDEGFDHVIVVPLLLTVSSHSFDDIPTIVGLKADAKTLLALAAERTECYTPRAQVTISPLLDFSRLLVENLPRRIAALSREPTKEGVVLVAYGDATYREEWETFFSELDRAVRIKTGVAEVIHCWCGHIVGYSRKPTQDAVRQVLSKHQRAIVIPVLVARDRTFQEDLIGRALDDLGEGNRVAYIPDAILPEPMLNDWVVSTTRDTYRSLPGVGVRSQDE